MRTFSLIFVACALCALVLADDIPPALQACSFRLTAHITVTSVDGEELATSLNEIIHDNGDFWVWKSQLNGNQFISSIVPDHEWSIIWRPDKNNTSYRHDIMAQKCYESQTTPTPFEWIESKTYGIVWFDEPVRFGDKEATLYTAVAAGAYGKYKYESTAGFYVTDDDGTLVHINGTLTANNKEIEIFFSTNSISFEHNQPINPKVFAVEPPCGPVDPPPEPSQSFKDQCYKEGSASVATASWLALLMALLAVLLNF